MGAVSTSIAMHFASAGAAASSSGDGGGGPRRLPCSGSTAIGRPCAYMAAQLSQRAGANHESQRVHPDSSEKLRNPQCRSLLVSLHVEQVPHIYHTTSGLARAKTAHWSGHNTIFGVTTEMCCGHAD